MAVGDFLIPTLQRITCAASGSASGNPYSDDKTIFLPPGLSGGILQPLSSAGDAITRWACGLGPPPSGSGPTPNPYRPITNRNGGFCDVSYSMNVAWNYKLYPSGAPSNNPPTGSAQVFVTGPIIGLYAEDYPSPNLVARNAAGTTFNVASIFNDSLDFGEITSVVFTRLDGFPDNCQETLPAPISPPITVPDPRGPSLPPIVIVPLGPVFIGPIVPTLSFNIDVGGVELNLTVELNTGDTFVGPPGGLPNQCCVPELRSPPGVPGDAEDQGPDLQYIAGIHTRTVVNSLGSLTEVMATPGDAAIYAPRLGSISFKVRAGSFTGWTADMPIKHLRQWTPVPGGLYAVDYQIISGYDVQITPIPVYIEPPNP